MGYLYTQLARFFETVVASVGLHSTLSVGGISFFGFPVAFSAGAYAFAIIMKQGGTFWPALVGALGVGALLGAGYIVMYRRLSNDSFAVFSLASVLAFDALVRSWDSVTGGVLGIAGVSRPPFARPLMFLVVFQAVVAVAFLLVEYGMLRAPFGRALLAHRENKNVLESLGVSAHRTGSYAILFACVASAAAGLLTIWRIQFLDPSFGGIPLLIQVLTVAILALRPRIAWLIGATVLIVLIPEALRLFAFPAAILGHLRLALYAAFLLVLVGKVSARYRVEKRIV